MLTLNYCRRLIFITVTGLHYLCDMSCQVTEVYAEESTVARFSIDAQATVRDLKQRLCSELAKTGERSYGFTNGFPHYSEFRYDRYLVFHVLSFIHISGSHGQLDFVGSTTV
jgi:hypothetical protein